LLFAVVVKDYLHIIHVTRISLTFAGPCLCIFDSVCLLLDAVDAVDFVAPVILLLGRMSLATDNLLDSWSTSLWMSQTSQTKSANAVHELYHNITDGWTDTKIHIHTAALNKIRLNYW